jgi:hypothetical protein
MKIVNVRDIVWDNVAVNISRNVVVNISNTVSGAVISNIWVSVAMITVIHNVSMKLLNERT